MIYFILMGGKHGKSFDLCIFFKGHGEWSKNTDITLFQHNIYCFLISPLDDTPMTKL